MDPYPVTSIATAAALKCHISHRVPCLLSFPPAIVSPCFQLFWGRLGTGAVAASRSSRTPSHSASGRLFPDKVYDCKRRRARPGGVLLRILSVTALSDGAGAVSCCHGPADNSGVSQASHCMEMMVAPSVLVGSEFGSSVTLGGCLLQ